MHLVFIILVCIVSRISGQEQPQPGFDTEISTPTLLEENVSDRREIGSEIPEELDPELVTSISPHPVSTEEATSTGLELSTTLEPEIVVPKELTIVVTGKSGSGISSTIRQILGKSKSSLPVVSGNPIIAEYILQLNENSTSTLRILDVEGLVNGKTIEDDALILATIKDYFQNPSISSSGPIMFIIVSNFDDNRFFGPHTQYTKVLSRISLLQNSVFQTQSQNSPKNIFLLTRHQAETRAVQRRSKSKVEIFAQTLGNFTKFGPPYKILVGENYPDSDLTVDEHGFVKLLNKDLYPKNIFDAIAQNLKESNMPELADEILRFALNRKNSTIQPTLIIHPNSTAMDSINDFQDLINLSQYEIEDTEVNIALRRAFDEMEDLNVKNQVRNSIAMLQAHLQYLNITNFSQLPKTTIEKVKFFQLLPSSLMKKAFVFLQEILDGYMPEYIQPLVVGSGYDILTDQVLAQSPFQVESLDTSSSGYLLPSYITCQKYPDPITVDHFSIISNYDEYKKGRISKLYFDEKDNLNISLLQGPKRTGYNYDTDDFLQTEREIRTFKFILNDEIKFNEDFLLMIRGLNKINIHNRDSVDTWKKFFNTYGTHVVTSGFVGGRIQGLLSDESLLRIGKNEKLEILENMVTMNNLPGNVQSKPRYTFFGGDLYENLSRWNTLSTEDKNNLLENWITSLKFDPYPLNYELYLDSIDQVVSSNGNSSVGDIIKIAKDLYLDGKMVFIRKQGMGNKRNKTKPEGSSTTAKSTLPVPTRRPTTKATTTTAAPEFIFNPVENANSGATRPVPSDRPKTTQAPQKNVNHLKPNDASHTGIPSTQIGQEYPSPQNLSSQELLNYYKQQQHRQESIYSTVNATFHSEMAKDNEYLQQIKKSNAEKRKLQSEAEIRKMESRNRKNEEELAELERMKQEYLSTIKTQAAEDIAQRKAYFDREIEMRKQEMEKFDEMIRNITLENFKKSQTPKRGACLRAGTQILLQSYNEIEVEHLIAGDYVLDHEFKPVRVIGVLRKFLGYNDNFFGFHKNGPFFFTKTHLMVGSNNELYVTNLEALLEENPLMEFLDAEQFNQLGNEFYEYSPISKTMQKVVLQVYPDPEPSSPDTWVYIILVDSKEGIYIANHYATRHELPPLELWPNTVNCILGLFNERISDSGMRNLLDMPYALDNVELLTESVINLQRILEIEFANAGKLFDQAEAKDEEIMQIEPEDNIMEELYANPVLSHLVSDLYRLCGKLIANELDNPNKPLDPLETRIMITNIQNLIMKTLA